MGLRTLPVLGGTSAAGCYPYLEAAAVAAAAAAVAAAVTVVVAALVLIPVTVFERL